MPEETYIADCTKCKEAIFDQAVSDGNEKFHDECFHCDYSDKNIECNKLLKDAEFHRKQNKRYCSSCYTDFIAETCFSCKEKIVGTKMLHTKGDNKYFHYDCFTCSKCPEDDNQIGEKLFTRIGSEFICQECYKAEHPDKECQLCGEVINTAAVKDNESHLYHKACFICSHCQGELAGKKYINRNNERYCKDCFDTHIAPICSNCDNRIKSDSQVVTYNQKPYCRKCFICHKCSRSLASKSFYDRGEDVGFECADKDSHGVCKP